MNQNSKFLKVLLLLLFIGNIFLGFKYVRSKYFSYNPDFTYDRRSLFEKINGNIDSSSIVFIGNSLTQQFELAELFKNINVRNRGINGNCASDILSRLDGLIKAQPKKIFIEIGVNDLKNGYPKDELVKNYKKILARIQQESKSSKVYVQSMLPVYSKGGAIVASGMKNEPIREVNNELQAYCKTVGVSFINLYEHFQLDGEMNPKYCIPDGLHISGEGYLLWTSLIKDYVNL